MINGRQIEIFIKLWYNRGGLGRLYFVQVINARFKDKNKEVTLWQKYKLDNAPCVEIKKNCS